jgi:hypothetical protein
MYVDTTPKICYTNLNRLVASGFPTRRFLFSKRNFVRACQYKIDRLPNGTLCVRTNTKIQMELRAPVRIQKSKRNFVRAHEYIHLCGGGGGTRGGAGKGSLT